MGIETIASQGDPDRRRRRMSYTKVSLCHAALALALSGCGGPTPTLDTSSDATTEATLKAMTADMSDAQKKRFQEDCNIATIGDEFSSSPPKGNAPKDKLASLNGLTVDEIRSRAAVLRDKLSR
jgi:hypothetical protein